MNTKTNIRTIVAVGAILAASFGARAASAQSDDGPRSVAVRYADLDLRNQDGAREMVDRIGDAAARACGEDPEGRLLDRQALYNHCKREAVARAVNQLDAPVVTAMAGQAVTVTVAGR